MLLFYVLLTCAVGSVIAPDEHNANVVFACDKIICIIMQMKLFWMLQANVVGYQLECR